MVGLAREFWSVVVLCISALIALMVAELALLGIELYYREKKREG